MPLENVRKDIMMNLFAPWHQSFRSVVTACIEPSNIFQTNIAILSMDHCQRESRTPPREHYGTSNASISPATALPIGLLEP